MIPSVKTGTNNLCIHLGRNHAWNNSLWGLQSVSPLPWYPFLVTTASGDSPSASWAPCDPRQHLGHGLHSAPMEHRCHTPLTAAFFHYMCVSEIKPGGFLPSTPDTQPHSRIQMWELGWRGREEFSPQPQGLAIGRQTLEGRRAR